MTDALDRTKAVLRILRFVNREKGGYCVMDFDKLYPVQMYCPNCGAKVIGYKDDDGGTRIICSRCYVRLFSKQRTKREINIRMTSAN